MQERMKVKYNKKRNTAFLYETLVRELTKAIVNKNDDRKRVVLSILKEHFNNNSVLYKELDVYKSLYESKDLDANTANRMIQEAKRVYSSLNSRDVFNQQTQVINRMNKQLEASVFSTFLPNYKNLATISQLFDDDLSIKQKVILEQQIFEIICESKEAEQPQMRPIDNLIYKQITKKFNDKYSEILSEEQKTLFSKYILSYVDNNVDFLVHLNEEISRIKKVITSSETINESEKKSLLFKIEEIVKKPLDKNTIESVLNFQSLIKEIQS
jgi:hypothetical protein